MSRKYFVCTLAVLLGMWLLGSCSGTSVNSANNVGERYSQATEDDPFVTELIAGAGGWNNGGWPDHGTDVGQVSVWNDGTYLYVKYETDGEFYFGGDPGNDNLHLWVGEDASGLPGVAPGQFPWSAEVEDDGTTYTFMIPLTGFYPDGGYEDGGHYSWGFGDTLEILAHGVTCHIVEGDDGGEGGGDCEGGLQFQQGVIATKGLYYGATDVYVGDVTFWIDGFDLCIGVQAIDGWYLRETQLFVGFDEPPFAPGQWPYQHSPLPDYTTYDEYCVSLIDLGVECDDVLNIALHATLNQDGTGTSGESATTWDDDCRFPLVNPNNGRPHDWKSYTCLQIPCEECTPPGPGEEEEVCETAWGFDLDGDRPFGDGVSRNEDGWFPNYFGITRWGWVFEYLVTDNS